MSTVAESSTAHPTGDVMLDNIPEKNLILVLIVGLDSVTGQILGDMNDAMRVADR